MDGKIILQLCIFFKIAQIKTILKNTIMLFFSGSLL